MSRRVDLRPGVYDPTAIRRISLCNETEVFSLDYSDSVHLSQSAQWGATTHTEVLSVIAIDALAKKKKKKKKKKYSALILSFIHISEPTRPY
eukprot:TRINITY_DN3072_c4_g1_i34.p2 TRINITY_DN3072_c4_g1~~TRINITY_DN3072_c4_g1_i34.p2  ORF type:complete len:92 (+),score=30.37 TRINITY_DN3072_c4_g1_i34:1017-1292(+)